MTARSTLSAAIARMEAAWAQSGHPLAGVALVGADEAELREEFFEWTGLPIPEELLELWVWWDGRSPVDGRAVALPGPLCLNSSERARKFTEQVPDELLSERTRRWIRLMVFDSVGVWAELDEVADDGGVPLTLSWAGRQPDADVIRRFGSIAELIDSMAFLIEGDHWSWSGDWLTCARVPGHTWAVLEPEGS